MGAIVFPLSRSPRSVPHRETVRPYVHRTRFMCTEMSEWWEAVEQLTGLRTDGSPPRGPRAHRVIKRLGGPSTSCSQVQTRRTHAHRPIFIISSDILRRRVIYDLQTVQDTSYNTREFRGSTGKSADDVEHYVPALSITRQLPLIRFDL